MSDVRGSVSFKSGQLLVGQCWLVSVGWSVLVGQCWSVSVGQSVLVSQVKSSQAVDLVRN